MSLETHVCHGCGKQFDAHESSTIAQLGYCSRQCFTGDEPA